MMILLLHQPPREIKNQAFPELFRENLSKFSFKITDAPDSDQALKNPAYVRQSISRPMRIVAPMP
jgi:hypothetical protein